ncbi:MULTISPECIES: hypothetical protein [Corynebacterium]|uniref:Glycosyltransferase n=1 Tax=Corynebacterium flavescens TaxID=28028 RepID=A0A1L7CPU2_CORFL|nr:MULTISPECIES: hypothetical protein [Corynebacterium]APT87848.1 glycosyltransferase [Corynebacterium flavescens]KAA8719674.1 hypothetical protein F4V60_11790 [Corynebacterium flavescens]MDN6100460.1 hypothetical protein [Corynebacterium flavescens]MDN6199022.1 hypothetical protein [Corynebacterium flavescens]MDN6225559.1 hypothetical protein [Corynebacterium flavescens]
MLTTIIGIVSITLGFFCVLAAYYRFQQHGDKKSALVLGIAALIFLTVIPVAAAIFFAATSNT